VNQNEAMATTLSEAHTQPRSAGVRVAEASPYTTAQGKVPDHEDRKRHAVDA
jgi:hypothetical protein